MDFIMTLQRGSMIIVAAPSGGGKTSLVRAVLEQQQNVTVSISHTTRPKRQGEIEGKDYYFVTEEAFNKKIQQGDFLEYAHVFDHMYGTCAEHLTRDLDLGMDVLLDIDWQGARAIKKLFPEAISVFILPPSIDVLRDRLEKRKREDATVIASRMHQACSEIQHFHEFDYLIVNDDFDEAVTELQLIIKTARLRRDNQASRYRYLIETLQDK